MREAVTRKDSLSGVMVNPVQASRVACSEVRMPGARDVKRIENK